MTLALGVEAPLNFLRLFGYSGRGLASQTNTALIFRSVLGTSSIAKICAEQKVADGIASFVMLTPMRG